MGGGGRWFNGSQWRIYHAAAILASCMRLEFPQTSELLENDEVVDNFSRRSFFIFKLWEHVRVLAYSRRNWLWRSDTMR